LDFETMSELALEELLSPEWMAHLKDIIEKQVIF